MAKVLISDKLSPAAVEIFRMRGIDVDVRPGLSPAELREIVGQYDGLAIRSATKVTKELLDAAPRLKVVGRAGIGVDNVDVKSASARGVVVMNTPHGNAITTAEHAIAMMFALARQIPEASASTKAGKWEKNRFMGVELTGKTLGLIGCGNIGSIVADRAVGLKMKVAAYDPFLTEKRAIELGVEKVELDALFARADFITLHTPLTDATRNILSRESIGAPQAAASASSTARAAAWWTRRRWPRRCAPAMSRARRSMCSRWNPRKTARCSRSTAWSARRISGRRRRRRRRTSRLQVAEQMSDFLLTGAVTNAINMPSVSAEDAPRLKPYMELCRQLGAFAGQLTQARDGVIRRVTIEYEGLCAHLNHRPLTAAALAGLMSPMMEGVNMVSAPIAAREHGIDVSETVHDRDSEYQTLVRITVQTGDQARTVAGTLFAGARPRIVEIKGIPVEADFARAHALRHEQGQAGLHRPFRRHAGRGGHQHRDLPSRPRRAGRRCDLPRVGG